MNMSFFVAGFVLLLALLAAVAFDGAGVRPWHNASHNVPASDAWWMLDVAPERFPGHYVQEPCFQPRRALPGGPRFSLVQQ
jgi:hypothetical protein